MNTHTLIKNNNVNAAINPDYAQTDSVQPAAPLSQQWLKQIPPDPKLIRIPEIYNRQSPLLTQEHPAYFPLLSLSLGEFAQRIQAGSAKAS